jgi:pimeloyl-ACP methyl ester carboxylesterase
MRTGIFILEIIFSIIFLSFLGFYLAIRPFKIVSSLNPGDLGLTYEEVSFKTDDNLILRGWFIPNKTQGAKTIILLHGYPADKGNILPAMAFLNKNYNLLLFDFRYLGKSEGNFSTAGKKEVLDLQAAIKYLNTRNIHEVGIWGFSLGGAVALMTAPNNPAIKAMIAESSYARLDWMAEEYYRLPLLKYLLAELTRLWGWIYLGYDLKTVAPVNAIANITIPVLLIYSSNDDVVSSRHGELLEQAASTHPNIKVIKVENLLHGHMMPDHDKVISDFFAKHL